MDADNVHAPRFDFDDLEFTDVLDSGYFAYGPTFAGKYMGEKVLIEEIKIMKGDPQGQEYVHFWLRVLTLLNDVPCMLKLLGYARTAKEDAKPLIVSEYLYGRGAGTPESQFSSKFGVPEFSEYQFWVVFEYCPENLLDFYEGGQSLHLQPCDQFTLIRQVCEVLRICHAENCKMGPIGCHRMLFSGETPSLKTLRLKPRTLFVDDSRAVRRCVSATRGDTRPDLRWLDKTTIRDRQSTFSSDLWSLGLLSIEIITREKVFEHLEPIQVATRVAYEELTPEFRKLKVHGRLMRFFEMCFDGETQNIEDIIEVLDGGPKTTVSMVKPAV